MGMGLLGGAEVNGAVLGRAHVGAYRKFHCCSSSEENVEQSLLG